MIDGAADEAQLQPRKRGAQQSADISKTASSRVNPTVDVEEQSKVNALNTEPDNGSFSGPSLPVIYTLLFFLPIATNWGSKSSELTR